VAATTAHTDGSTRQVIAKLLFQFRNQTAYTPLGFLVGCQSRQLFVSLDLTYELFSLVLVHENQSTRRASVSGKNWKSSGCATLTLDP
jgi:hypothetical protein